MSVVDNQTSGSDVSTVIRIRGARTHNLKNVDVDLPAGKLIVMTGVSGSGKSSLAFDTLFAEGQRRYLESVSVHARSWLHELPRPDVDDISGLPPTVSVDQRSGTASARSTLAVTTDVYEYLRLLYARAGTAHCIGCGQPVTSQSVDEILARALLLPERTRLMVLSPLVRGRRGGHRDVLDRIARSGFVRARVDGELVDVAGIPPLNPATTHHVEAVVDRIVLKTGIEQRLRESIDLACRESDGTCMISWESASGWQEQFFSTRYCCPACQLNFATPEPRTFSFHSAWGACPACQGFGFQGVTDDSQEITVFRTQACCDCQGSRLQKFASAVTFLETSIAAFTALTVDEAIHRLQQWSGWISDPGRVTQQARLVAERLLPDMLQRLTCLQQVGVGYLTLDRPARTLSGGEYQRARLSACLGSGLHGACFVLDEPTTGLHPRDTQRLLQSLLNLRDGGATVVVVEHDGELMRAADWLIDLGPQAGREGGRLLYSGPPDDAATSLDSPTGHYLRGELAAEAPASSVSQKTPPGDDAESGDDAEFPGDRALLIRGAQLNNLQNVTVTIPLQRFVCVTGVSGSGKSSLIVDTLLPLAIAGVRKTAPLETVAADCRCDAIEGLDALQRVVAVDAAALSRNPRSCMATISGLWDEVRRLFAKTRDARARGFRAARFSFNSGDGRCAECRGTGLRNLQMRFLPNAVVPCPTCRGRRFNQATLSVRFHGLSVAEVLDLRVDEAADVFSEISHLQALLQTFCRTGLGYLTLGQPASTFSGGEAQRVRLATELCQTQQAHTLYVLDEPTSGLHPADVLRLNQLLRDLVRAGHSVIAVEHNTDVMRASDWLIDLGPDSGPAGGEVLYAGPPSRMASAVSSLTAAALRESSY